MCFFCVSFCQNVIDQNVVAPSSSFFKHIHIKISGRFKGTACVALVRQVIGTDTSQGTKLKHRLCYETIRACDVKYYPSYVCGVD